MDSAPLVYFPCLSQTIIGFLTIISGYYRIFEFFWTKIQKKIIIKIKFGCERQTGKTPQTLNHNYSVNCQ